MKNRVMKFTGIRNLSGILLSVLCSITLLPATPHARNMTPDQTVLDFYHRYMITCANPVNNKNGGLFCGMDIGKYATKELRSTITGTNHNQPAGKASADMEADYFTHTQDFDAQWAAAMAGDAYPADIAAFVHDAEICQYLAGEWDSTLADDRKKDLTAQAATQCDSIHEKQEYLAKKYRSNTKLLSKINAYDF